MAEAEKVEEDARGYFCSLVGEVCPNLDVTDVWKNFDNDFLLPMIRNIGANTYRLIAGESQEIDAVSAERFLNKYDKEYSIQLKTLIAKFLDPKMESVRSYITRILHAHFCVESSGVSQAVLDKLEETTKKPVQFVLFVDTNFLFCILGLHENPSNTSARELKDLLSRFKRILKLNFI